MQIIRNILIISSSIFLLTSCEKDPKIKQNYLDLELKSDWQEFTISNNEEITFKISIENESRIDLAWQDANMMNDGESFTSDITVSAFRPDGTTPYFENNDNGFQDDSKIIEIEKGDNQVIILVSAKNGSYGSFSIRARGISDVQVTNPKNITFGETWVDKNCKTGEIKWLEVDCGTSKDIAVEWMEFDRPKTGSTYTADIVVSVFSEDLATTYVENKNHGYDTNKRIFNLSHSSSIIYIKVSLNDDAKPGSYSIRAYAP